MEREMACTYIDGKKKGEKKWYYENGQLFREVNYIDDNDDNENCEYKEYHQNGQLSNSIIYNELYEK